MENLPILLAQLDLEMVGPAMKDSHLLKQELECKAIKLWHFCTNEKHQDYVSTCFIAIHKSSHSSVHH